MDEAEYSQQIKQMVLESLNITATETIRQEELIDSYVFSLIQARRYRALLANMPDRNDKSVGYIHDYIRKYSKESDRIAKELQLPLNGIPKGEDLKIITNPDFKEEKQKNTKSNNLPNELVGHVPSLKPLSHKDLRIALLQRLGPCVDCGEDDIHRLEPYHMHGASWEVSKYSSRERIKRYLEDEAEGLLQSRCRSCNASDGAKRLQAKPRWKEAKQTKSIKQSDIQSNDKRPNKEKTKVS